MTSSVATDEGAMAKDTYTNQVSMFKDLIVPEVIVTEFEDEVAQRLNATSTPGKVSSNDEEASHDVNDDSSDKDDHTREEAKNKDCLEDIISGIINTALDESAEELHVTKDQVIQTVGDVINNENDVIAIKSLKVKDTAVSDPLRGGGGGLTPDCQDLKGPVHRMRSRANTGDSGISLRSLTSTGSSRTTSTCSTDSMFKPLAIVIGEGGGSGGVPLTPTSPPHTDTSTLSDVFPDIKTGSQEVNQDTHAEEPLVVEAPVTSSSSVTSPLPELSPIKEKSGDEKCGYFNELFPKLTVDKEKWMSGIPEFDLSKSNRFPGQSMSGLEDAEAFHHRSCGKYYDNINFYEFRNGQFVNGDLRRQDTAERAMEKDLWMYHDYYGSDKHHYRRYTGDSRLHSQNFSNQLWAAAKSDSANSGGGGRTVDLIEWMVRFKNDHLGDLDDDPNILMYDQEIPTSGPERERCDRISLKFAIKMYKSININGSQSASNSFSNDPTVTSASSNNHGRRMFKPLLPPPPPSFNRDRSNPVRPHRHFPDFYRNFKN